MRSYRSLKVAEAIRNELLILFQSGAFSDPLMSDVTISHVELSKDGSNIKAFFTMFDADGAKETEKALNKSAGYVRTLLAQSLNLGFTPTIRFQFDHISVAGNKLDALLNQISQNNENAQ